MEYVISLVPINWLVSSLLRLINQTASIVTEIKTFKVEENKKKKNIQVTTNKIHQTLIISDHALIKQYKSVLFSWIWSLPSLPKC